MCFGVQFQVSSSLNRINKKKATLILTSPTCQLVGVKARHDNRTSQAPSRAAKLPDSCPRFVFPAVCVCPHLSSTQHPRLTLQAGHVRRQVQQLESNCSNSRPPWWCSSSTAGEPARSQTNPDLQEAAHRLGLFLFNPSAFKKGQQGTRENAPIQKTTARFADGRNHLRRGRARRVADRLLKAQGDARQGGARSCGRARKNREERGQGGGVLPFFSSFLSKSNQADGTVFVAVFAFVPVACICHVQCVLTSTPSLCRATAAQTTQGGPRAPH